MPTFDISALLNPDRPSGAYTAALLHALARDEAAGRRQKRLTEPNLATWARFRGRLTSAELAALLFEDAGVTHPIPFGAEALDDSLTPHKLSPKVVDAYLDTLANADLTTPGADYITEQARLLGVPTRLARADLYQMKAHQKALELPGTGGQLAHHMVSTQPHLTLHDNFVIACEGWRELTLAGIVALERAAPHTDFIKPTDPTALRDPEHPLRRQSFDLVIGLHPDKGGLFGVDDQLAIWYPSARVQLV